MRDIAHGRVWSARSAFVVHDRSDRVALAVLPGAACKIPTGYEPGQPRDPNRSPLLDELERNSWELRDHSWEGPYVLFLLEPERWYSVNLMFDPGKQRLLFWYVNFQRPFTRSRAGFDSCDLLLDLVVGPDRSFGWKDEDEFREGRTRGLVGADEEAAVLAAGDEVLARLERRAPPFDDEWTSWRPDPAQPVPRLPEGWDEVGS